jgi:maltose alpha-D-glucosyltransferase/alpha-amylase
VDFVQPGTLLLAEACQPPTDVVAYFGNGDEVHGAYHFPLMPQIYLALARESSQPLLDILDPRVTPEIPEGTSWFTFLRCHDELTLEMVNNEERALLNEVYCHDPDWSFREGEGISARLADLFQKRALPILLMHSILLTLDGVPILYYGDEFAERNQKKSLEEFESRTGLRDSRALVRGRIDWERVERKLDDPESLESRVFYPLKKMLKIRTQRLTSLREAPQFHKVPQGLCAYSRNLASGEEILFLSNLSAAKRNFNPDPPLSGIDVLTGKKIHTPMILPAYGIFWIEVSENSASSATFD